MTSLPATRGVGSSIKRAYPPPSPGNCQRMAPGRQGQCRSVLPPPIPGAGVPCPLRVARVGPRYRRSARSPQSPAPVDRRRRRSTVDRRVFGRNSASCCLAVDLRAQWSTAIKSLIRKCLRHEIGEKLTFGAGRSPHVREVHGVVGSVNRASRPAGMATLQIWVNRQPGRSKCLVGSNLRRLTFHWSGSTTVNQARPGVRGDALPAVRSRPSHGPPAWSGRRAPPRVHSGRETLSRAS